MNMPMISRLPQEIQDHLDEADANSTYPMTGELIVGIQKRQLLAEYHATQAHIALVRILAGILFPGESHEYPHVYFSTSCFHKQHDYCQNTEGQCGPKTPGKCKFCDAKCICWCHAPTGDDELR